MNDNNEKAAYETWRNSLPNGSLDVIPVQAWQARGAIVEQERAASILKMKRAMALIKSWDQQVLSGSE